MPPQGPIIASTVILSSSPQATTSNSPKKRPNLKMRHCSNSISTTTTTTTRTTTTANNNNNNNNNTSTMFLYHPQSNSQNEPPPPPPHNPSVNMNRMDDADIAAGVQHLNKNGISHERKALDATSINTRSNSSSAGAIASTSALSNAVNSKSYSNAHHANHVHNYGEDNSNSEKYKSSNGTSFVSLTLQENSAIQRHPRHRHDYNPSIHETHHQSLLSSPSSPSSSSTHFQSQTQQTHQILQNLKETPSAKITHEQILILGINISNLPRKSQFIVCASGVFSFSLLYGYLQELISVALCNRQLGLFLGMMQFLGYAIWSRIFHIFVQSKKRKQVNLPLNQKSAVGGSGSGGTITSSTTTVPMKLYVFLSILRAIDAGMTNMAMAYVNYPAKTLMKSSRVVFTMLFGALIRRKRYNLIDYIVVTLMVSGLVIFMHADSKSSAVFQPLGIMMLTTSLLCDGAINNMSEAIMIQYKVGQDEFIYHLYSIAVIGIAGAAYLRGDLNDGIQYTIQPGTWDEIKSNTDLESRTWSVFGKFMALFLFSSAGFFGSSCSALITKEFGALTMSITSTARKATTLFLSFALFNNVCTLEHVSGIVLFITALIAKSLRASGYFEKNKNVKGHNNTEEESDEDDDEMRELMMVDQLQQQPQEDVSPASSVVDIDLENTPKSGTSVKRRRWRRNDEVKIASIV